MHDNYNKQASNETSTAYIDTDRNTDDVLKTAILHKLWVADPSLAGNGATLSSLESYNLVKRTRLV